MVRPAGGPLGKLEPQREPRAHCRNPQSHVHASTDRGDCGASNFFVSSVLKFPIAYHTFRPVLVTRWMLRLVRPDRIRPEGVIRLSMARFFDAVIGVGALVAQHLLIAGQQRMPIFVRVLLESVARLSTLPGIPAPNATTVVHCAPCTMCISRYRPRYT
jgi:hypothetical protein